MQPAVLEDRGQHAVGGADREHVHHRRLQRDHHRAEREHQQQEAERDHDHDLERQLARDVRGEVDVAGGGAADVGLHVGALLGLRDHARARACRPGSRSASSAGPLVGDRVEVRGGAGLVDLHRGDRRDARVCETSFCSVCSRGSPVVRFARRAERQAATISTARSRPARSSSRSGRRPGARWSTSTARPMSF